MNTTNTLSLTEARRKIFKIADDVHKTSAYYVLTDQGKAKAVVMSAEEFESWMETLDVMREMPRLKEDIAEAKREYARGEYVSLDDMPKEAGYVAAEKLKKNYGVSGYHPKKGPKKFAKN